MPFKFDDAQTSFEWLTTASGLPIGDVRKIGTGEWLTVCPLCGCTHDVSAIAGDTYQPTCELRLTHPTVFAGWLQKHRDAAQHTTVHLRRVAECERKAG